MQRGFCARIESLESRRLLSAAASAATPDVLAAASGIISPAVVQHPAVTNVQPTNSATNAALNGGVTADLSLPNGGLDPNTVNTATVTLKRNSDQSLVPSIVNTTGGGDAIILQPSADLAPNTAYTFTVTAAVKDITGVTMTAFSSTFTTGTSGGGLDQNMAFQKVTLPTAQGAGFTGMAIGPDGKLYAATEDGRIFRWAINADGTLAAPQVISSLQFANGGNRLITGFAFDPRSTPTNPIIWVSNSFYALSGATNGVDFTGKITVMSGADLETVQDAVINLPRSVADHVTNQPVFGPDGALYFAQAAENAFGAPDTTWGNRPEHLLSAAVLRLNINAVTPGAPLDAKTPDAGGSYNPFANGAPLTIYATGVRNAFDLLWDSSGNLWAPTNGSSAGGNSPAFSSSDPSQINGNRIDTHQPYAGPNVPALTNIQQTEDDYLYKVAQGGYYGHPNPTRGEFVLDDGNPTSGAVADEVFGAYPAGTNPDPNYRGANFDFGPHHSPDGIIQYQGSAFGGMLDGKMLVAEYSAGDDIAVLTTDSNDNVVSIDRAVSGFTGFNNPVDLIENPANGFIYVAELGANRITLLRPTTPGPQITASASLVTFSTIAAGNSGAGASPVQSVTITNTGSAALTLGAGGFTIANDPASTADAGDFTITNAGSIPASLAVGQSFTVQLSFTAPSLGIKSAFLKIASNDPNSPTSIALRGVGMAGFFAGNEPSLQRILDLYNIPDNVGEPNPNSTFFPTPPSTPNDELYAPRFTKAGDGPVTIQLLAAFAIGSPIGARVGYYSPGDTSSKQELFTISGATNAAEQTVDPAALGATSFDPGAAQFGLYTQFPHFLDNNQERVAFSEDALNTWDTNVPRKMRTYPMKNADGSVVPNSYVVAFEDYNLQYDSNDVVAIIRNVTPQPTGPTIGVANPAGLPFSDRIIFNRIQNQDPTLGDIFHDTSTLQITNSGESSLSVSALTLSDPTNWQIVNPPSLPFSVAPGASQSITIKFIAQTVPAVPYNETNDVATTESGISPTQAGGVYNGTLTVASNDAAQPNKAVQLAGYWQHLSAHEEEPSLQTIVNLLAGYGTNIASGVKPDLTQGKTVISYGEEVLSGLWQAADSSHPVSVEMLNAFHNQGNQSVTSWYKQGTTTNNMLFHQAADEGQTLFPHITGTNNLAIASFTTSNVFGWNLDGEKSEDNLNTTDITTFARSGHSVRFFPLRDRSGNLIPNAWIMTMDYQDTEFDNDDYQDLTYIVTNMRPAATPPSPTGFHATLGASGINLQWEGVSYGASLGYNVFRSATLNGTLTKLNSSALTTTSFIDTTAAAGTSWFYQVKSVDTSNGHQSPGANSTVSLVAAAGSATSSPVAPSNLTAFGATDGINLSWTASPGATSYEVDRQAPGTSFAQLATGITDTTYQDTSTTPGVTYSYHIIAINDVGSSPASATVSAVRGSQQTTGGADVILGTGGAKQIRFTDADGTLATIILKTGSATVHFDGTNITTTTVKGIETVAGTNVIVGTIAATGTTSSSTLSIKTKGGDNLITVGGISTDGSFRSITAKTSELTGNLSVAGTLGKLQLASASGGAITIGSGAKNFSLQLNSASNETLTAAGVISSIKASGWDSSTITTPQLRAMTLLHDASLTLNAGVAGNITVKGSLHDSTITISAPGTKSLTKLNVSGSLTNTTVHSAGGIGGVSVGGIFSSKIFAGVASLPGSQVLPQTAADFVAAVAIGSLKVHHVVGTATFVDSSIAASIITRADLGGVQLANSGTPFGVAAQSIKSLTLRSSANEQKLILKNATDDVTLANEVAASGLPLQDLVLRIV
ncbi:MAG TPA: Ig-like domain-containing protein [Humisphaera sp.]|jgi:glucose/arabinose dehydrogenase|nr:Ig-like domain-containing protein [Humisphaera sp.]